MNRVPCEVPFCRRTTAAERIAPHTEWICAIHWRLIHPSIRRLYRAALKENEAAH